MVTMKDIANAAGVSRPTVSQVLSGQRAGGVQISAVTQKRVLETAIRLGYHRNELARAVKRGRTNVVAFIGGASTSYDMRIIAGINAGLQERDFTLKMFILGASHSFDDAIRQSPAAVSQSLDDAIRQCREQMVAGIICRSLQPADLEQLRQALVPSGIPVMQVDGGFLCDWCGRVMSDDIAGGRMAAEHLLSLGHRRIGLLAVTGELRYSEPRRQGYRLALKNAGITPDPDLEVTISDHLELDEEQRRILTGYLRKLRPTAVFCVADPLAMKMLAAANQAGIKVPEELSVVGYADLDYASFSIPLLTTIAQPFEEEGRLAAASLVDIINSTEPQIPVDLKLPVKLVLGTGPYVLSKIISGQILLFVKLQR